MFDFFKDVYLEMKGLDINQVQTARDEAREQKKLSRYIFSKGAKTFITVCGVLYLFLAISMLCYLWVQSGSYQHITKYSLMSIYVIAVLAFLLSGSKKGEIIALVGCFMFVVLLYTSLIFPFF